MVDAKSSLARIHSLLEEKHSLDKAAEMMRYARARAHHRFGLAVATQHLP